MKCRQCDNEAVYADGLCESCHACQQEDVQVMSRAERDGFTGQTVDEEGRVYTENVREDESLQGRVHIYTKMPLRIKAALAVIIFLIAAVIVGIFGLLLVALPYLLAILGIYIVYSVVRKFLS